MDGRKRAGDERAGQMEISGLKEILDKDIDDKEKDKNKNKDKL